MMLKTDRKTPVAESRFSIDGANDRSQKRVAAGQDDEQHAPGRPTGRRGLYRSAAALIVAGSMPAAASVPSPTARFAFDMGERVRALAPELERYVRAGMEAFDVPGAAVGIVTGDRLVYAKGFGWRRKGGKEPVDTKTVFQIGSATKAFLAAMLALAVDRGKLEWDARVVDLVPSFSLKDPYVTREFRVYDLLAQRSGLPPYVNDALSSLGFDDGWLVRSLRFVEPITSFRSTFAYTNITHLIAGRIAAKALGAADWPALAKREILEPLGMHDTSFTAEAIKKAADHAVGHRWGPSGSVEIPFDPLYPYPFGPAGDINATLEDCARWLRLQIGDGTFAGRRLVSAKNLAVTRTPKVSITETVTYAMGWVISDTLNGRVVWHNGGTNGFGAQIGFLPHRGVGVIVLTNQGNKGFPDAVGLWAYDKLLNNPETDYVKVALARTKAQATNEAAIYKKPLMPQPSPNPASLAGQYESDKTGPAMLAAQGDGLLLTLKETGARLRLIPFDGALFTVQLVSEGRFAPGAAALGGQPVGFAGFEADADGRLSLLRWTNEGQSYLWKRIVVAP